MYVQELFLSQFRSYEKAHLQFSPSINLIQGENAQGKTNLLEALHFLSTGRSFRSPLLAPLIRTGSSFFFIEAHFVKDGLSEVMKASFDGQVRKMQHNSQHFSSFSPLLGLLPSVLIAPQDLALVTGAPQERRHFLDLHLAQSDPLYVHHLTRYMKALKQRNALLKSKTEETLESWEQAMAHAALYILQKRLSALRSIKELALKSLAALSSGHDTLELHYHSSVCKEEPTLEKLIQEWAKQRKKELHFGMTLVGPHRDDITLLINEKGAKNFSSEGQKRSLVTALRLAEWQRLRDLTGYPPLLCIDDFGIHLDAKRYALIQKEMQGLGQVFLTTPHHLEGYAEKTFLIEQGEIRVLV